MVRVASRGEYAFGLKDLGFLSFLKVKMLVS